MSQENIWEREYRNSKLLVKQNIPSRDVVDFVTYLKKEGIKVENLQILDLGSGMGRNSFYFTEMGAHVIGLEISKTAIQLANENAKNAELNIDYRKQSIGEKFPFKDGCFDIILDILSSNSLFETEREMFLKETYRVLKPNGYFLSKTLCKDGDANAKILLKQFPGKEKDTYVMPGLGVIERVWSREDFVSTYGKYFKILHLEKKTRYTRMNNRSYKRNFWLTYMKK